jgi:hypothetical protein
VRSSVRVYTVTDACAVNRAVVLALNLGPTGAPADGGRHSLAAAMVANLAKPTLGVPALLRHDDAATFFHEMGTSSTPFRVRGVQRLPRLAHDYLRTTGLRTIPLAAAVRSLNWRQSFGERRALALLDAVSNGAGAPPYAPPVSIHTRMDCSIRCR